MTRIRVVAPLVFLASVIASHALAQGVGITNLAGDWTCRGSCQVPGGRTHIDRTRASLTCTNEVNQISQGQLTDANTLTCWGLDATLSSDARAIDWHNNSSWVT
jgi:hypothetical protein